jgi:hypothetical protein
VYQQHKATGFAVVAEMFCCFLAFAAAFELLFDVVGHGFRFLWLVID